MVPVPESAPEPAPVPASAEAASSTDPEPAPAPAPRGGRQSQGTVWCLARRVENPGFELELERVKSYLPAIKALIVPLFRSSLLLVTLSYTQICHQAMLRGQQDQQGKAPAWSTRPLAKSHQPTRDRSQTKG